MLEFLSQDRSTEVTFHRAQYGRTSHQQAYLGLLSFRDEVRKHAGNRRFQSAASNLPSKGRTPFRIVDVSAAKRPPYIPASDLLTSDQQGLVDTSRCQLRVYMDSPLCDRLKRTFAFNETSEPSPLNIRSHGRQYITVLARPNAEDAGLFADVAAE